ncbi:hypothetical protein GS436_07870 [Rhodococcus hoagii]|nr:hypothetical protein [Prescottella equi]
MKKTITRVLLTVGAAGSALLLATGVASAHVSVAAPAPSRAATPSSPSASPPSPTPPAPPHSPCSCRA